MKTIVQKVLIAGLCMTAPAFIYAEDQSSTSQSGETSTQGTETHQHMHGMQGSHQISSQNPTDANRASKIIGMDVYNQQNRKLGTVKDLIVDPKTQSALRFCSRFPC